MRVFKVDESFVQINMGDTQSLSPEPRVKDRNPRGELENFSTTSCKFIRHFSETSYASLRLLALCTVASSPYSRVLVFLNRCIYASYAFPCNAVENPVHNDIYGRYVPKPLSRQSLHPSRSSMQGLMSPGTLPKTEWLTRTNPRTYVLL